MIRSGILIAVCCYLGMSAKAQPPLKHNYAGFDANEYPGDDQLSALHQRFAFAGYWLNNPPGANHNSWAGKRNTLLRAGFGFVVIFNGRLDREILAAQKAGRSPSVLARDDAAAAVDAARRDRFPTHTIIFLDQEEGGRLLPEQATYLFTWTESIATSGYRAGAYASGMPVPDEDGSGRKTTITTIQDIRQHVAAQHLHTISFWTYQDACPPAPGCVVGATKLPTLDASGTPQAEVWQFAQSPRRPEARACAVTYARDGNCYLPGGPPALARYQLDLSVSNSPAPSHGR